jgi:hypothetical protein
VLRSAWYDQNQMNRTSRQRRRDRGWPWHPISFSSLLPTTTSTRKSQNKRAGQPISCPVRSLRGTDTWVIYFHDSQSSSPPNTRPTGPGIEFEARHVPASRYPTPAGRHNGPIPSCLGPECYHSAGWANGRPTRVLVTQLASRRPMAASGCSCMARRFQPCIHPPTRPPSGAVSPSPSLCDRATCR